MTKRRMVVTTVVSGPLVVICTLLAIQGIVATTELRDAAAQWMETNKAVDQLMSDKKEDPKRTSRYLFADRLRSLFVYTAGLTKTNDNVVELPVGEPDVALVSELKQILALEELATELKEAIGLLAKMASLVGSVTEGQRGQIVEALATIGRAINPSELAINGQFDPTRAVPALAGCLSAIADRIDLTTWSQKSMLAFRLRLLAIELGSTRGMITLDGGTAFKIADFRAHRDDIGRQFEGIQWLGMSGGTGDSIACIGLQRIDKQDIIRVFGAPGQGWRICFLGEIDLGSIPSKEKSLKRSLSTGADSGGVKARVVAGDSAHWYRNPGIVLWASDEGEWDRFEIVFDREKHWSQDMSIHFTNLVSGIPTGGGSVWEINPQRRGSNGVENGDVIQYGDDK